MTDNVINMFNEIVKYYPDNMCLICEDGRSISYVQIDIISSKLCNCINKYISYQISIPLVCILLNRDIGFISSILGCFKAEVAYVPVDPY